MLRISTASTLAALALLACLFAQPLRAQQPATTGEAAEAAGESAGSAAAEPRSELARIAEAGTLRVGVNPAYMPFSFLDEGGERVGVDIDIATELAEGLGLELALEAPESFSELVPMLVDGEIDLIIAGMSITLERAAKVSFSDPYFDTGTSLLMNVGTSTKLGIGNERDSAALLAALEERGTEERLRVAVTEGKAPAQVAERRFPQARITAYPTNEEAAEAVLAGEADVMVHDEIFLKVWLKDNASRAGRRLVVLDPPITPDFYGIAARQGDAAWLALLDVFVRDLRANGRVIGYLAEYLPSMDRKRMADTDAPSFELTDME